MSGLAGVGFPRVVGLFEVCPRCFVEVCVLVFVYIIIHPGGSCFGVLGGGQKEKLMGGYHGISVGCSAGHFVDKSGAFWPFAGFVGSLGWNALRSSTWSNGKCLVGTQLES